ncbi:hypothetical protein HYDPIDRAFT_165760 [Hydnomerulius pinastri MD-312]|nr:hypothetical protein HYDPIDRAFT_165760 [Hydnomerulius pinastri MD-312]
MSRSGPFVNFYVSGIYSAQGSVEEGLGINAYVWFQSAYLIAIDKGGSIRSPLDISVQDFSGTGPLQGNHRTCACRGAGRPSSSSYSLSLHDGASNNKPPKMGVINLLLALIGTQRQRKALPSACGNRHIHVQQHPVPSSFYPYRDLTSQIERQSVYPVAYGGYGDVHCCLLNSEGLVIEAGHLCFSSDLEFHKMWKMLYRELSIWARLRHENIIPFYGVAFDFGPFPAFVCPWAANGTLNQYLTEHVSLGLVDRLNLLCDVASGLHYLHCQKVVHGDLTGTNILIDFGGRAYLSDFGLSTIHREFLGTSYFTSSSRGNVRWAAPELFEEPKADGTPLAILSEKTDIYSFGSVMLQVLSGQVPFSTFKTQQVFFKVSRGERPPRESFWDGKPVSDVLWAFIVTCWEYLQSRRPSSGDVLGFIRAEADAALAH